VESAALVPITEWRALLRHATRRGEFLGVDPDAYPRDFAVFVRYHLAAKRIAARYGIPGPLPWSELKEFLASSLYSYEVKLDHEITTPAAAVDVVTRRIA
jgi:hypothetical protein